MITLFSNRVYKKTLNTIDEIEIEQETYKYNQAKWAITSLLVTQHNDGKPFLQKGQSLHMYVKSQFSFNDYMANSVINDAKGILASRIELQQLEINTLENRISTKQEKIKTLQKELKAKQAMLSSCITISQAVKKEKPRKKDLALKTYRGCKEKQLPSGIYAVQYKRYTRLYFNLYEFEHTYLRPEIKRIKNIISMITHSVNLMKDKLVKMKLYLPGITFGTKNLFRAQYTKYQDKHETWKVRWQEARTSTIKIVGRGDGKYGNFVFKYKWLSQELAITLNGKVVTLRNLTFPYGQELLNIVLLDRSTKTPLTWEITDHGEYYIIKVIFEPPKIERNYDTGSGVVSYDKNYDHIAWTELDGQGKLIQQGKLPFNLEGKTVGQASKILESTAIGLVQIAREAKKPLVGERINTNDSKGKLAYGSKKRNLKLTQFAYNKMDSSIESRANKEGVGLIRKNPAYTSVIGKMKYMRVLGTAIHTAAAYVIGRRGLGFKEKVPMAYRKLIPEANLKRHHWSHWRFLHRHLKDIPVRKFYELDLSKHAILNVKFCKTL